ncbi:MAG: hypothetical protein KBT36_17395 [Kurthia sp.]|nr:hypothetical protein [Candidatus Kurthia equi]
MSLASYIGTNIPLPTEEERADLYDDTFWIGDCFSDKYDKKNMTKHHFTTKYVYEVSSHWGIIILPNDSLRYESISKLRKLLQHVESYMQLGDYFQLYTCWLGEETDKSEDQLSIELHQINFQTLEIPEKTVVTFYNSNIKEDGGCS